jgi:hypothetical protein
MIRFGAPGSLERIRKIPSKYKQSFFTPLHDLEQFVSTIMSAHAPIEKGYITIDRIVFEPKSLKDLLVQHSVTDETGVYVSLEAIGQEEIGALLRSALADWIDFVFVPTPTLFVMYTDHEEFTTFYANKKGALNRIVHALSDKGF